MEFFPEIMVTDEEGELIARGMLAVARADGQLHDREITLVQGFLGEATGGSPISLTAVQREGDIEPDILAAGLAREAVGMLFVKSCILLAYADGVFHPAEKEKILSYAKALGISDAAVTELEQSVKEFLVGQFTHLADREAVVQVARELEG